MDVKRMTQNLTIAVFLLAVFGFSLAFWILPDRDFSEQENRALRTLPAFTLEKLASGKFSDEINDYFADQFPIRDALVGVKGFAEIAMGKRENDGILLGADGYLAKRRFDMMLQNGEILPDMDAFDEAHVRDAAEAIRRVSESLEVPFSVFLTGRTVDVAASKLAYPSSYSDALLALLREELGTMEGYIDSVPLYRERLENGEDVYYRTDHHWTSLGAYYASVAFCNANDIVPYELDTYETVVKTGFMGTLYGWAGKPASLKENPDYTVAHYPHIGYSMIAGNSGNWYNTSALNYNYNNYAGMFINGDNPLTLITSENKNGRTLMIFKESYGNAFVPFMIDYFEQIVVVDIREETKGTGALIDQYGVTDVIFINNCQAAISFEEIIRSKALS